MSASTSSMASIGTTSISHQSTRPPKLKLAKSGPPTTLVSIPVSTETPTTTVQNGPTSVDQQSIKGNSSDRHPRSTSESLQSASHSQSPTITPSENSVGNRAETAEIQKLENFSSPISIDSTHQNELLSNLSQGKSILTSPVPTNNSATASDVQQTGE